MTTAAEHPELELRARTPGVASMRIEDLNGRTAMVVRIDSSRRRGALAPIDGETMAEAARTALEQRLPLVMFMASSGADAHEGVAALHGWGRAARVLTRCSGAVPLIFIIDGPTVSGSALLLGLGDVIIMTADAYAFVSGANAVRRLTGVLVDNSELGGAPMHATASGVATMVVGDLGEAEDTAAEILAFLPDHTDLLPPLQPTTDPVDRPTPDAASLIPPEPTGSYDVRRVAAEILDDGYYLELRSQWAPNLVTLLGSLGGRSIGVVANQPLALAGTLDITASQKGARFVSFCDAFNLPLLTLVDTPGFYPGKDLEWRGMIRHGAQLAFAYARATVPRLGLVLRKSYGGAYIVMDSKTMGNDLCLAWPSAEIAVMGARQAAEILRRRSEPAEREEFVLEYEDRYLNPWVGAERGLIDMVVDPADTRRVLCEALDLLASKREELPERRHDNTPL